MSLKDDILSLAKNKKEIRSLDIANMTKNKFSRQYINKIVNDLIDDRVLVKIGSTRSTRYVLKEFLSFLDGHIKKKLRNVNLMEHEVYELVKHDLPHLSKVSENIQSIIDYAFSEMLNNAIEHSKSKYIEIEFWKGPLEVGFIVNDFGIGVFRNIMKKRKLNSEFEAIQDLLKGKLTTQPRGHSGEGIFFTSKVGDLFTLESFEYRLRVDNKIDDVFLEEIAEDNRRGTKVTFTISLHSKHHLQDVFKEYETDPEEHAFDKTRVRIKLFTMGTIYISRSQARRVLVGLERFKTIILDFDKVPTIGQAFADEIFRVFRKKHPEIEIMYENTNDAVNFMIDRVSD